MIDNDRIQECEDKIEALQSELIKQRRLEHKNRWTRRIRWTAFLGVLVVPVVAWTAFTKPHADFTAGTPISSSDVNDTIDDIYDSLNYFGNCPAGTSQVGHWCIDDVAGNQAAYGAAISDCHSEGKSLCSFDAIMSCDYIQPAGSACTDLTDTGGATVWTSANATVDATDFRNTIVVYNGTNVMEVEVGDAGPHQYLCCSPVIPIP
jgi:hypothetical protein